MGEGNNAEEKKKKIVVEEKKNDEKEKGKDNNGKKTNISRIKDGEDDMSANKNKKGKTNL